MDRVGTRRGLSLTVMAYSLVAMATSMARGFYSFITFRSLLGLAESGNWPGATKAVSEWFPKRERGLATALFDSGSSIGGAIAPFIIVKWIQPHLGWRLAFVLPGLLGFLWLVLWRKMYYRPQEHPRIGPEELRMITADLEEGAREQADERNQSWQSLLKLPQAWGTIIARAFTDPVWFFVVDWFPIYLVSKGISLQSGLVAVWVPFVAADLGNFFGGWASGFLIKRGWSLGNARKAMVIFGGVGVLLLIPSIVTNNLYLITLLFALSTFSYATFTTIANVFPSDLFYSQSVASVSGMSGTAAGIGTIIAFKLIGYFSDAPHVAGTHSFDGIVTVAGIVPFIGMLLVLLLVRNTKATRQGLVRPI